MKPRDPTRLLLAAATWLLIVATPARAGERASGTELTVRTAIDETGVATEDWLSTLRRRLDSDDDSGISSVRKPLSAEERAWEELIRSRLAVWPQQLPAVEAHYHPASPPSRVGIVLGNRGASDAFTHDPTTMGFDLAALHAAYISLSLPFRMGSVNCYLIETDSGYVLIDTGSSYSRKVLVREFESAGGKPGLLKLIVLTHGDFDHTGNAAYLRNAFGGEIAMHPDDAGMVVQGDMFVNRKRPNTIIRKLLPFFSGFGKSERFTPDLLVKDGDDLSRFGLDASVISIPGHSKDLSGS